MSRTNLNDHHLMEGQVAGSHFSARRSQSGAWDSHTSREASREARRYNYAWSASKLVEQSLDALREGNSQDGLFALPDTRLGVALCWELIRHRTVARLLGKIDLLLAGSAWMQIDPEVGFPGLSREEIVALNVTLLAMLRQAPVRMAELLGVPVIHANLVGPIRAHKLFKQAVDFVSRFAGESKIVAAGGKTLASRSGSEGEGIVVADIVLGRATPKAAPVERFWIPELPPILRELWYCQGAVGREYYLRSAVPHRHMQRKETP